MKASSLIAESGRVARSRKPASIVTGLVASGACIAVLVTTGQTVQAEAAVIAQIDAVGTRSLVIADPTQRAGIPASAVAILDALSQTEWVLGVGYARDVRNGAIGPGGLPVPVRTVIGDFPDSVHLTDRPPRPGEVVLTPTAARTLGLELGIGGVVHDDQELDPAVGLFTVDPPLQSLAAGGIKVAASDFDEPMATVHVVATSPQAVAPLADVIVELVGAEDPTELTLATSETLADLRAAVAGDLGRFNRQLVLVVLLAVLALNSLAVSAAVTAQRQAFGRRRALGASRGAIVAMVAAQYSIIAIIAAAVGTAIGSVALGLTTSALPDPAFAFATMILVIGATVAAALPPAVVAAFRDPVRVLRVP